MLRAFASKHLAGQALEFLGELRRDGVPEFRLPEVEIVYAVERCAWAGYHVIKGHAPVEIHILGMPGKCGLPHPEIEKYRVDTMNSNLKWLVGVS